MRFDKIVFYTMCVGAVVFGSFVFGAYSASRNTPLFLFMDMVYDQVKESIKDVALSAQSTVSPVAIHLHPTRHQGSGVISNTAEDQDSLIFLSGFFEGSNGLRLIRRDGEVVAKWPVEYGELFPDTSFLDEPPKNNYLTDLHGALINPDGSVVFNFEYAGTVKLSRCGDVVWTLKHPGHHSVEKAESGGYWIPGRMVHNEIAKDAFPPFTSNYIGNNPYEEDQILKVSEDGEIEQQISVPRIFYNSNLLALLTATGGHFNGQMTYDYELLHLNKIGELKSDIAGSFKEFEAGDLVLSLREHNLIVVVDPKTWKIRWYQVGPWLRQHDPEFNKDGTITVFNNNAFRYGLKVDRDKRIDLPRTTEIVRVDPTTHKTVRVYGGIEGEFMLSHIMGKHDPTSSGGFFITEYEAGRALEIDADGNIVWEYVNSYDDENVADLTEAKVYAPSYFNVQNWSCP